MQEPARAKELPVETLPLEERIRRHRRRRRHAMKDISAPKQPMTLSEAKSVTARIVEKWIASK